MKVKNILLVSFLFMCVLGLTVNSVSALKVPTKYTTKTYTNYYYESGSYYDSTDRYFSSRGAYVWQASTVGSNYRSFSYPTIHENYLGSTTQLKYYIYNNNNNPYHWADVRSSTLTVKYKVKTKYHTYYKSKIFSYTTIPKTGTYKTHTFSGYPSGSKVLIYNMKWSQVHREWYPR